MSKLILSVDRTDDHPKGPKHIVNLEVEKDTLMSFRVPAGVIIGKDTVLTLKKKTTDEAGAVEIRDIIMLDFF